MSSPRGRRPKKPSCVVFLVVALVVVASFQVISLHRSASSAAVAVAVVAEMEEVAQVEVVAAVAAVAEVEAAPVDDGASLRVRALRTRLFVNVPRGATGGVKRARARRSSARDSRWNALSSCATTFPRVTTRRASATPRAVRFATSPPIRAARGSRASGVRARHRERERSEGWREV